MSQKTLFSPTPPMTEEEARHNAAERTRQNRGEHYFRRTILPWLLLFVFTTSVMYFRLRKLPFDSAQWKLAQPGIRYLPATRERMLDDLIKSGAFKGLHQSEVTHLLGKPDGGETSSEMSYTLRVVGLGSRTLRVHFDTQQRVVATDTYVTD